MIIERVSGRGMKASPGVVLWGRHTAVIDRLSRRRAECHRCILTGHLNT